MDGLSEKTHVITLIENFALLKFLNVRNPVLYAKVLELRRAMEEWLGYIPQTFPHYTRHSVLHSDAIIQQISNLLFKSGKATPTIQLSPMEAYIAAAAAYLHDAGMVCSDAEKMTILASDDWSDWTTNDGAGAARWIEIQQLRGDTNLPANTRDFLADVLTRFLLAEYVRRLHPSRAKQLIAAEASIFAPFAFGDPVLARTIGDVCEAHGLEQSELEDRERFPDRRDIQGEQVNVRFLALLLRLGDLLDLSYDRACPLLLNAACPLPPESLAHWSQYQRITHRVTAPDCIEITAACENQEEHRFLKDWCRWLVGEVDRATVLVARCARHSDWQLPRASIDTNDATIKIEPSKTAKYIPSSWHFELDPEAVFKRLISDVYSDPNSFVRELLQNAFDATRCQLYLDLQKQGMAPPNYPTQTPSDTRLRYPVHVVLEDQAVKNELSGEMEPRQVLIVEDLGIGMDRDVLHRYLLQVGRSFYATNEFQRRFRFVPTSRFGVGFLSVFGVSDRIEIDTFKPSSPSGDGPLRIVLTGPRNYLLLERGERRISGPRIAVLLRKGMQISVLESMVKRWCRRVEFPIIIKHKDGQCVVSAENAQMFEYETPDVRSDSAGFKVRSFPVDRPGIEGNLFVFTRIENGEELWNSWKWSQTVYADSHPLAQKPTMAESVTCMHGIAVSYRNPGAWAERIDYRDNTVSPSLSRESARSEGTESRLQSRWGEIVSEHLQYSVKASSPLGWEYKQSLVPIFPIPSFWHNCPATIPLHRGSHFFSVSLRDFLGFQQFATLLDYKYSHFMKDIPPETITEFPTDFPAITASEIARLSDVHRREIFSGCEIVNARVSERCIELIWNRSGRMAHIGTEGKYCIFSPVLEPSIVAVEIHKTIHTVYATGLLNSNNAFVQWLLRVAEACEQGNTAVRPEHFTKLMTMTYDAIRYGNLDPLNSYLLGWSDLPGLPINLIPPLTELTAAVFGRTAISRFLDSSSQTPG